MQELQLDLVRSEAAQDLFRRSNAATERTLMAAKACVALPRGCAGRQRDTNVTQGVTNEDSACLRQQAPHRKPRNSKLAARDESG